MMLQVNLTFIRVSGVRIPDGSYRKPPKSLRFRGLSYHITPSHFVFVQLCIPCKQKNWRRNYLPSVLLLFISSPLASSRRQSHPRPALPPSGTPSPSGPRSYPRLRFFTGSGYGLTSFSSPALAPNPSLHTRSPAACTSAATAAFSAPYRRSGRSPAVRPCHSRRF